MTGSLMQLAVYGPQDAYLTANPQMTHFLCVYRRHTNFAIENFTCNFRGHMALGKRVECTLKRYGELVWRVYLRARIKLENAGAGLQWVPYSGLKLIKSVSVSIGGLEIDRHTDEWLYIWNQLSLGVGKQSGYDAMVGAEADFALEKEFYIPLEFWFCRDIANALPLIGLEHHDVKIHVEFEEFAKLFLFQPEASCSYDFDACLCVDYIMLDVPELRRFAFMPMNGYLMHQVQEVTDVIHGNFKNIHLPFNHPVKELIWTVQSETPSTWIDYALPLVAGEQEAVDPYMAIEPLTFYGGTEPWVTIPTDTIVVPEGQGWNVMYNNINGVDDSFYLIPDLGVDLFVNAVNVRNSTEFWTNNFIKFDGQGYATIGPEGMFYPDETTPTTLAVHIGSLDYDLRVAAFKTIQEDGQNGVVIHIETITFDEEVLTHLCVMEVSLFDNGDVRFSIPAGAPLCLLNAASWGLSDGTRWLYRLSNPLEANKSYVLNLHTNFPVPVGPTIAAVEATVVILNSTPIDQEHVNDVLQSYFTNIIQTVNADLGDVTVRPDVVYIYNANLITEIGVIKVYNWVTQGTLLYINATASDQYINAYFDLFSSVTPIFQFNNNSDSYYAEIVPNPIVRVPVIPYINVADDVYGVPPNQIGPDVQVIGYGHGTQYAVMLLKRIGIGYVLLDAIDQKGLNYRVNVWNDIYMWVLRQSYQGASPIVDVELLMNGTPRFAKRPIRYFNTVQPYQHHTRIPSNQGIHVYSFAIAPEEVQPSGSLNLSRIDDCTLRVRHGFTTRTSTVKVYAWTYNMLQVSKGMGGLRYSS